MANGSFSGSIINGAYTLQVNWSATPSVENNASTPFLDIYLVQKSTWSIGVGSRASTAVINGTTYNWTASAVSNGGGVTTKIGSVTGYPITHNADGSKSIVITVTYPIQATISGTYYSKITASATVYLDNIPRVSDFTISEGTLGVGQNITVTRQSTAFTHGLTYSCGSVKTQLICAWNTTASSVPFTPPTDLAWQAPNGTRVWVDVHLQTYYNGNPIGGVVTKGVWMNIPESAAFCPQCSVAVSDPTGYADKFGAYIQGQSKMTIKVTPYTAYGSNIVAYSVTADGTTFNRSEVTTPVIRSTGTVGINVSVKDTRSRYGYASDTIEVLPYTPPVINQLKVHRCDEDGTENDRGLFAKVTYGYTVDTIGGKNDMSAFIQYKKTTDTQYTDVSLPKAFVVDENTFIFPADDAHAYDVQISIADSLIATSDRTTVSTGFSLIHYATSGRGITFGGIDNSDGFHIINIPFTIEGVEVDYIVEQGEIDGWFYRKWNGGFAECWKVYYGTGINSAVNNYSGFYYSETITVPFPFIFTNLPTITVDGGSSNYMNFVRVFGKYSDKASFVVVGMVNAGNVDVTVDIKAIGRWK
jgi:hypothetical protein